MSAGNNPPAVMAVLTVVGLLASGGVGYLIYDIQQATSGVERVDGTVLDAHVEENPRAEGGHDLPVVEYRYTYEGETYENDNVFAGPSDVPDTSLRGDGPDAREVLDRYEQGETVTVYVDPDDPSESYLIEDNPPRSGIGLIVFGTGFSALLVFAAARSG